MDGGLTIHVVAADYRYVGLASGPRAKRTDHEDGDKGGCFERDTLIEFRRSSNRGVDGGPWEARRLRKQRGSAPAAGEHKCVLTYGAVAT